MIYSFLERDACEILFNLELEIWGEGLFIF